MIYLKYLHACVYFVEIKQKAAECDVCLIDFYTLIYFKYLRF